MNARTLKIALAVSVALNLFAVAAGATVLIGQAKIEDRIEAQQRPPRDRSPAMIVVSRLDPQVRERVRAVLKEAALAAKPDFEEARLKRRQAVALAAAEPFDAERVAALLAESRTAELRGRARLEANAVQLLGTLDPADRAALSEILTRKGRTDVKHRDERAPRPAG